VLGKHQMSMLGKWAAVLILALATVITSCGPRETAEQKQREANTPAGKMGQLAHKAAVQADKAGRVIGRELSKAAHDAHEGWNEDARKSRTSR
jgi:hypothetical protein